MRFKAESLTDVLALKSKRGLPLNATPILQPRPPDLQEAMTMVAQLKKNV
jgi:hypothetical protein